LCFCRSFDNYFWRKFRNSLFGSVNLFIMIWRIFLSCSGFFDKISTRNLIAIFWKCMRLSKVNTLNISTNCTKQALISCSIKIFTSSSSLRLFNKSSYPKKDLSFLSGRRLSINSCLRTNNAGIIFFFWFWLEIVRRTLRYFSPRCFSCWIFI